MLHRVDLAPKALERYKAIVGEAQLAELRDVAGQLRGRRVAHINATAYGGGVSELLRALVPLYSDLGIDAHWLVIPGSPEFFDVTKGIHNALQGADYELTDRSRGIYLGQNQVVADQLERGYDFIITHDPQPAPLRTMHGADGARWIWRCHIDTSAPSMHVLRFLEPFLRDYDALVFTMEEFVPDALRDVDHRIIPPGIDPLSPKNMAAPSGLLKRIVEWTGVDTRRPLIAQISRFDPWKDPLGVIDVYRRARIQVPGLQLALLGQMALDDPEGWRMYQEIGAAAGDDPDLHLLTNFTGIGNMEVNAFQACSDVVLQKSLREGFGLVVSETLWKGTAVVAGRAGGIPMQMPEGVGGYLVDDIDQCVDRTVCLLQDRETAHRLGSLGHEHVREHFLITRLLADELRLLASLA